VADQQQPRVGAHPRGGLPGLRRVEAARQRPVNAQALGLAAVPPLRSQLGGLRSARLGAEQHRLEVHLQPRQRRSRDSRLALAARRQPALLVGAGAVRLSLCVT